MAPADRFHDRVDGRCEQDDDPERSREQAKLLLDKRRIVITHAHEPARLVAHLRRPCGKRQLVFGCNPLVLDNDGDTVAGHRFVKDSGYIRTVTDQDPVDFLNDRIGRYPGKVCRIVHIHGLDQRGIDGDRKPEQGDHQGKTEDPG